MAVKQPHAPYAILRIELVRVDGNVATPVESGTQGYHAVPVKCVLASYQKAECDPDDRELCPFLWIKDKPHQF